MIRKLEERSLIRTRISLGRLIRSSADQAVHYRGKSNDWQYEPWKLLSLDIGRISLPYLADTCRFFSRTLGEWLRLWHRALGHLLVSLLVRSHCSLVCLHCPDRFARALHCANSSARSLNHSLPSLCETEWLDDYSCCFFVCSWVWTIVIWPKGRKQ